MFFKMKYHIDTDIKYHSSWYVFFLIYRKLWTSVIMPCGFWLQQWHTFYNSSTSPQSPRRKHIIFGNCILYSRNSYITRSFKYILHVALGFAEVVISGKYTYIIWVELQFHTICIKTISIIEHFLYDISLKNQNLISN